MKFLWLICVHICLLLFFGCSGGFDVKALAPPEGVVRTVGYKSDDEYSIFAVAMRKTVKDPHISYEEMAKAESKVSDNLKGLSSPHVKTIENSIAKVMADEKSESIERHLGIVTDLTKLIDIGGPGARLVSSLKSKGGDEEKVGMVIDEGLRTRLMQEVMHLRCMFLKPIGVAADQSIAHAITALGASNNGTRAQRESQRLKALLEFLKTAQECGQLDASLIFGYRAALTSILESARSFSTIPATELNNEGSYRSSAQAIVALIEPLSTKHATQFLALQKAMLVLNPAAYPYLDDTLEPLSFGRPDLFTQNKLPVELIKDQIAKGKKTITFALPGEGELSVYAEYFALDGNPVFVVDLFTLSKTAHTLQLDAEEFVKWAAFIINGLQKSPNPIVLLTGLGALNYDASINDKETRQWAMALNYNLLVTNVKQAFLLAPVSYKNQHLFINSQAAKDTRLLIPPLNLSWAEWMILNAIEEENRRDRKGIVWQAKPFIEMAKVLRAFKPDRFSLGRVIEIFEQLIQQRTLRGNSKQLPAQEERVAALELVESLFADIGPQAVKDSLVLNYTSAAIEDVLAEKKTAFSDASKIGIVRKETREFQTILANLGELQQKLAEAKEVSDELKRATGSVSIDALKGMLAQAQQIKEDVDAITNSVTIDPLKVLQTEAARVKDEVQKLISELNSSTDLPNKLAEARNVKAEFDGITIDDTALQAKLAAAQKIIADFGALTIDDTALKAKLTAAQQVIDDFNKLAIDDTALKAKLTAAQQVIDDFNKLAIDDTALKAKLTDAQKLISDFAALNIDDTALKTKLTDAQKLISDFAALNIDDTALKAKLAAAQQIIADFGALTIDDTALKTKLTDAQKLISDFAALNIDDTALKAKLTDAQKLISDFAALNIDDTALKAKLAAAQQIIADFGALTIDDTALKAKLTDAQKLISDFAALNIDDTALKAKLAAAQQIIADFGALTIDDTALKAKLTDAQKLISDFAALNIDDTALKTKLTDAQKLISDFAALNIDDTALKTKLTDAQKLISDFAALNIDDTALKTKLTDAQKLISDFAALNIDDTALKTKLTDAQKLISDFAALNIDDTALKTKLTDAQKLISDFAALNIDDTALKTKLTDAQKLISDFAALNIDDTALKAKLTDAQKLISDFAALNIDDSALKAKLTAAQNILKDAQVIQTQVDAIVTALNNLKLDDLAAKANKALADAKEALRLTTDVDASVAKLAVLKTEVADLLTRLGTDATAATQLEAKLAKLDTELQKRAVADAQALLKITNDLEKLSKTVNDAFNAKKDEDLPPAIQTLKNQVNNDIGDQVKLISNLVKGTSEQTKTDIGALNNANTALKETAKSLVFIVANMLTAKKGGVTSGQAFDASVPMLQASYEKLKELAVQLGNTSSLPPFK